MSIVISYSNTQYLYYVYRILIQKTHGNDDSSKKKFLSIYLRSERIHRFRKFTLKRRFVLRTKKTSILAVTLTIFLVTLFIQPANSSINASATMTSGGSIYHNEVIAASGYWRDIQNAIDNASLAGIGIVRIPAGKYNFVNINETWTGPRVIIPGGISIFGAQTERDSNDQVIQWKTILNMPWEVPMPDRSNPSTWFAVQLNESLDAPFRFSDIEMIGWRFYNNNSTTCYIGLQVYLSRYYAYASAGMTNIRVDHNHFQDMGESAVRLFTTEAVHNRRPISGVIDHNVLVNSRGDPGWTNYPGDLGYGIGMRRWASDVWEPNAANVFGKYNNYTIVIEDNFFSKWRHATSSNDGIHQIVRDNIFDGGYGISEVDAHGSYADSDHPYAVGSRVIEVYNNIFKNPDHTWYSNSWAINLRGGAGIIFNNTLIGYYALLDLNNDWGNYAPYRPDCAINQTYIWNNDLGGGRLIHYNADSVENVNYFLRMPNLAQDGFTYMPYTYPAP